MKSGKEEIMNNRKIQKSKKDIEKITTPDVLKRNLVNASLILTAYELMKYSLIDQVKGFFTFGEEERQSSGDHKREMDEIRNKLPKEFQKHPLLVYALWFKEQKALNETDFNNVVRIWQYRNKLAHELIGFLVDSDFEVDLQYLYELRDIVGKIDVWWVKEIEIPINPDFDHKEVKDSEISSGRMAIIDHLISFAVELLPNAGPKEGDLVH